MCEPTRQMCASSLFSLVLISFFSSFLWSVFSTAVFGVRFPFLMPSRKLDTPSHRWKRERERTKKRKRQRENTSQATAVARASFIRHLFLSFPLSVFVLSFREFFFFVSLSPHFLYIVRPVEVPRRSPAVAVATKIWNG